MKRLNYKSYLRTQNYQSKPCQNWELTIIYTYSTYFNV